MDILRGGTVVAGLGLMGSSFARAIKDLSPSYYVAGLDREELPVRRGLEDHVLDAGAVLQREDEKARQLLSQAGLIILSMYPEGILSFIDEYREAFTPGTVVIDICGLKSGLVEAAQSRMPAGVEYMATHPMAGKEKSGYENGDGEMFLGATFILTPTGKNTREVALQLGEMASRMGFGRIRETDPEEHDRLIAYTSHLPHLAASALVASWDGDEDVCAYTGGSFRDATRVAEINAPLWADLMLRNRKQLLEQLEKYIAALTEMEGLIRNEERERLMDRLRRASERKKEWNKKVDRFDDGSGRKGGTVQ